MINKKLHYVWIGRRPIPQKILKLMKHNKKVLGNKWKIKIWTEKDFDVNINDFTSYWYEKKQWAFVSDYIRAYAVYKEGGFYVDVDIKLEKTLDTLLDADYVASRTYVAWNTMSIFGAKKGHKILNEYMNVMKSKKLIKKPPKIMSTDIHSYVLNNFITIPYSNTNYVEDNIHIYKEEILQLKLNDNCIAIHEHHNNWKGKRNKLKKSKYYYHKFNWYKKLNFKKIKKILLKLKRNNKKISKLLNFNM